MNGVFGWADFFALLVAVIHVYVFTLESLLWGKPIALRTFGVDRETAETNRAMAFNQGFYNLFLALGILFGLIFLFRGDERGRILTDFACACVFGAGAVLLFTSRRLLRPALVQMLPAALYFLLRLLSV